MKNKILQHLGKQNISKCKSSANTFHSYVQVPQPNSLKTSNRDSPLTYKTTKAFLDLVPKNDYLCYWAGNINRHRKQAKQYMSENKKKHSLNFLNRPIDFSNQFKKDGLKEKLNKAQQNKKIDQKSFKYEYKIFPSRLNTIVHPQQFASSEYNFNQYGNNIRSQKEISESNLRSKRSIKHIFSQKKINKTSNYLIRSQNKTYDLKENAVKNKSLNCCPKIEQLTKTQICFVKDKKQNLRFSAPRIKSNVNCDAQTLKKIDTDHEIQYLQNLNDVSIDIKCGNGDQQVIQEEDSLGFDCSAILKNQVKNDSQFLNKSEKEIFNQINIPKNGIRKRTWKKLPVDFLKARY